MSSLAKLAQLAEAARRGSPEITVVGASGPLSSLAAANLAARARGEDQGPVVFVCRDDARVASLLDEIAVFLRGPDEADAPLSPPPALALPEVDVSPYSDLAPDRRTIMARQAALFRLLHGITGPVLVLSVRSLMRRVMPPGIFDARCELLVQGQEMDRDDLAATLVSAGYQRFPLVEDPGAFTVRGGVVDLFPPIYPHPVRLELEGDQISSIRLFDIESQLTVQAVDHAYIHPVRETLVTAPELVRDRLLAVADRARHPSSRTRFLLEQIDQGHDFFGAESLVSLFHERLASPTEYLPPGCLWVVEEPDVLQAEAQLALEQHEEAYRERIAAHQLAVEPSSLFLSLKEIQQALRGPSRVLLTRLAGVTGTEEVSARLAGEVTGAERLLRSRSDITCSKQGVEAPRGQGARREEISAIPNDERQSPREWIGGLSGQVISERLLGSRVSLHCTAQGHGGAALPWKPAGAGPAVLASGVSR